jgi:hypothetical protein
MAAFTNVANSINNTLNGFIDRETMGLDSKIKSIFASHTEKLEKHDLIGRHFKIQDDFLYQGSQEY